MVATINSYVDCCDASTTTSPIFDFEVTTRTCPGIIFPKIKSQIEIQEEQEKKRKEEKLRLKVNRKAMFSKKGR